MFERLFNGGGEGAATAEGPAARCLRLVQAVLLGLVLLLTVAALYVRPFGARDGQVAVGGALAAWALGPLGFREGLEAVAASANLPAFFWAEAAGLYGRVARLLARRGTVRGRVSMVLLTGSGVTAVLSNDATPLVLTPAIFAAGPAGARATTDSAFAATFIADGASLLLPVSNPVNLLSFERFEFGFWGYLAMVTPAAAAGAAVLAAVTMRQAAGEEAASAPVWTASARPVGPALVVVAGLGAAYVGAGVAGFPLGLVTLAGGLAMAAAARLGGPVDGRQFRRHIAPGVLAFVAGLVLLVENVAAAGGWR